MALNVQRRLLGASADGVEFPLTCGRDFCGVVEARGAGVSARLGRGARVWGALPPHVTQGAHAQYVRIKESWVSIRTSSVLCAIDHLLYDLFRYDRQVAPAPEALDDVACAGAPYAALSAMALLRAAALPPPPAVPRVLLLGLGGAGQAALQLLVARGAQVTVGAAPDLLGLAGALGAHVALDRHAEDYWARVERGGPYAAVLDCAGLGGDEAGARRWRFARYVTLTSPLLRETDARGLLAGAATVAVRLAAQYASLPPRAHVRWAFFSARAQDLETLRRLAERGQVSAARCGAVRGAAGC